PDVEDRGARLGGEGLLEEHEAALGGAVMPGAEGPTGLDHDREPARRARRLRRLAVEPRRHHAQTAARDVGREGLLPGAGPRLVQQRGDLRVAGLGEAERAQRVAVGPDRVEQPGGRDGFREEGAHLRGGAGRLLLHHAEGALLPEEVGQAIGGVGGGGNGELPERHQLPKRFFIRSTNLDTRGLASLSVVRRSSSSSSRWRAVSWAGTSTITS